MSGNYIENHILGSYFVVECSRSIYGYYEFNARQASTANPTLHRKQGRQLQKTSVNIVNICSPALLHSYNIINDVFV